MAEHIDQTSAPKDLFSALMSSQQNEIEKSAPLVSDLLANVSREFLVWTKDPASTNIRSTEAFSPPYIVLMENLNPNRNMGRYDALALVDSVDAVISGGRRIFRKGLNQVILW